MLRNLLGLNPKLSQSLILTGMFAAELREGARPVTACGLLRKDCIIIGNEGHGIPAVISALCDGSIYLPISDGAESLNAAVAAGVLLWEQSKAE